MNHEIKEHPPAYIPPSSLPQPLAKGAGSPMAAVGLGILSAVVLGGALFVASQMLYFYILYNSLIGIGIGMAITVGIRRSNYDNVTVLGSLAVGCSILAYVVFNYVMYRDAISGFVLGVPSFMEFLVLRAENEPVYRDIQPGKIGSFVVWAIEAGITIYFALNRTLGGIAQLHVEAVPTEVTDFVLHSISEDKSVEEVRYELGKRGWSNPDDQDRALQAAGTVIQILQAQQEEDS